MSGSVVHIPVHWRVNAYYIIIGDKGRMVDFNTANCWENYEWSEYLITNVLSSRHTINICKTSIKTHKKGATVSYTLQPINNKCNNHYHL